MKRILVLGGDGYIGSRLRQVLADNYSVDSIDAGWYIGYGGSSVMDYRDLTNEELSEYDVIILLAGHGSVRSCIGDINGPWLNNVTNFSNLLEKLTDNQLLIYASSASVYGNSKHGQLHTESNVNFTPVNNYDLTKYVLDLTAQIEIQTGKNIIGLRFGTVNGWSPNLRVDVMINAMYHSAMKSGSITVTDRHIGRALLGIEDLCRAIMACIEQPTTGIYNLASFNTTVDQVSATVANALSVSIVDNGKTDGVYDFVLDCSLFQETFDFKFQETTDTIVQSLIGGYEKSITVRRDQYIKYNWENL
jgi:nucleoside-diphosphate-sugar epimerase